MTILLSIGHALWMALAMFWAILRPLDSLTTQLQAALGASVSLVVRSVITRDADRTRFLNEPIDTIGSTRPLARRRRR